MNVLLLFAALQSIDVEEGELGKIPPGWTLPPNAVEAGYSAELTEDHPMSGKRCLLFSHDTPKGFGTMWRDIDAAPYRGKCVRLRAGVRTEVEGRQRQAQVWLRVDREGGKTGFFDNMWDRPIRSSEWKRYEIAGPVAKDAVKIAVGVMLHGEGKAWLDDLTLESFDADFEGPRALEGRGLENLVAFTKLFGYVRHFHPSDEAAAADWEAFALAGVKAAEKAKDAAELAAILDKIFRTVAPTVRVFETGKRPDLPPMKGDRVLAWRHFGFGSGAGTSIYSSKRETKEKSELEKPFEADLGGGVSCLVPLELFADEQGTLPHAEKQDKPKRPIFTGDDRATRLADIALAWNVFQHFYPYFDVVQTDWPATLRRSLTSAATDADGAAFFDTVRRLVADLHDGHGYVGYASEDALFPPPILWDWIEDRLVVTVVDPEAKIDLKPGDVIRKIDGVDAAKALEEKERLISGATPQWIRHNALTNLGADPGGTEIKLELESRTVTLTRQGNGWSLKEARPKKIEEVKKGIWYVDIDRINDKDFRDALADLDDASGIVFDLRGYPNNLSTVVIAHLIDEPVRCAKWNVPIVTRPDREGMTFEESGWDVKPVTPRLKAKVAFVIDGRAISYAETYMGIIEHYKLAAIVGGPTAGTNGNVNSINLPGGYSASFTGMKVLKHDGSRHHGVGIQPTVPVSRTIKGVTEGRDELLEKAIDVVSN